MTSTVHECTLIASEQLMWTTLLTRFNVWKAFQTLLHSICYPFKEDAEVVSLPWKTATLFHLNSSGGEDEILKVRADVELKSRAHGQFWNLRNPNTRKHVNVLPPWLHYLAPLIYVSQSFPTWRSFSPSTVPPYWWSFGSVLEAGYQQTLSRPCIRGWFHARASHQRKVILWYCAILVHVVM